MAGELYRLDGLAVPDQLDRLHRLLATAAAEHPEVPTADVMALETAVLEVANNVVEHARPPGQVRWSLEVRVSSTELAAELADSGEAGPTPWLAAHPDGGPSGTTPVEAAPMPDLWEETGRGLPLAAALVDELTYRREADRNVWSLRRALGG